MYVRVVCIVSGLKGYFFFALYLHENMSSMMMEEKTFTRKIEWLGKNILENILTSMYERCAGTAKVHFII